jgi:hypothetical protein
MKIRFLIIAAMAVLAPSLHTEAREIQASGGLSTLTLIGNTPARDSFFDDNNPDDDSDNEYGGSLQETQRGFDLHINIPLSADDIWRIPIGIEYIFGRAREMQNFGYVGDRNITGYDVDLITLYSGAKYNIWKYPNYEITFWGSFELRGTFVTNIDYFQYEKSYENSKEGIQVLYVDFDDKETAFRIGTSLKIGGEGRLSKNVYLSWAVGFNCLNFLLRDNSYGELLVPHKYFANETFVYGYTVNIGAFFKL